MNNPKCPNCSKLCELIKNPYGDDGTLCNLCYKEILIDEEAYHCDDHEYDICVRCH